MKIRWTFESNQLNHPEHISEHKTQEQRPVQHYAWDWKVQETSEIEVSSTFIQLILVFIETWHICESYN